MWPSSCVAECSSGWLAVASGAALGRPAGAGRSSRTAPLVKGRQPLTAVVMTDTDRACLGQTIQYCGACTMPLEVYYPVTCPQWPRLPAV